MIAIGHRAVVTTRNSGADRVTVTDEDGVDTVTTVADGLEVEVLAWRPRRGGGTRYRILAKDVEGWIGAASLEAVKRAPAPPVAKVAPSAPPAAASRPKRAAAPKAKTKR